MIQLTTIVFFVYVALPRRCQWLMWLVQQIKEFLLYLCWCSTDYRLAHRFFPSANLVLGKQLFRARRETDVSCQSSVDDTPCHNSVTVRHNLSGVLILVLWVTCDVRVGVFFKPVLVLLLHFIVIFLIWRDIQLTSSLIVCYTHNVVLKCWHFVISSESGNLFYILNLSIYLCSVDF